MMLVSGTLPGLGSGCVIFGAALLAGALNSVAGGGSFISFPALLLVGVPAVSANTTSSTALLLGSAASAGAYRRDFSMPRKTLAVLTIMSLLGGAAGAAVLLSTPERTFEGLVPYLLAFATVVFALSGRIALWLPRDRGHVDELSWKSMTIVSVVQLAVGFYGGYFGGGVSILMLAVLALMGMQQINAMNAVKTIMATLMNGVAVLTFVLARTVLWPYALVMMAGALLGGYFGARYARQQDPALVRAIVIAVGALMSAYFFFRHWA